MDDASAGEPVSGGAQTRRRRLRFVLTFTNPSSTDLGPQAFWCYLPALATATQRLLDVQVSRTANLLSDAASHQILHLTFEGLPAHAQRLVTVTTELEMRPEPMPAPLLAPAAWLAAERFIETGDSQIRTLAAQLGQGHHHGTARAIYDWVRGNLVYSGYLADERGAARALVDRAGDCTEFADLAVALARASGIPARTVGGFVTDRDVAPKASEYHDWAEFHLDGAWRLVDCQKQRWLQPTNEYVAFRIDRDAKLNPIGHAQRFRVDGAMVVSY